jgi:signal transduction histidine kinase
MRTRHKAPQAPDAASADAFALLEAALRIAEQPELLEVVHELLHAAHSVLGFERVRFYRAFPAEAVLRQEAAAGLPGEPGEPPIPLTQRTILGRLALGKSATRVLRLRTLRDPRETPEGLETCLAPIRLQETAVGVVVADFPKTRRQIPDGLPQALGTLAHFAEVSIERWGLARLRASFVAAVSHELRTPLTSIRAFAEMLTDGDAGPLSETQARFVARITTGSAQLQRIVEDLLELSKLRSGTEIIHRNTVHVEPFLHDTTLNFHPQATACGIRLTVAAPSDLPVLHTDQHRLRQAIVNFIDNALKYSPAGTEVMIAANADDGRLRICVRDQGRGIPGDELRRIFEEFYRCRNGVNDTPDRGAGLGLAIVAQIAEMIGAEITVESTEGEGSEFGLVFPLETA